MNPALGNIVEKLSQNQFNLFHNFPEEKCREYESHQMMEILTIGHQFDLTGHSDQLVPRQAAHGQRVLQMSKDHLTLQLVVLVYVCINGDAGGVGLER